MIGRMNWLRIVFILMVKWLFRADIVALIPLIRWSSLEVGDGPENGGGWLITMADAVTDEIGDFVETLRDQ